MTTGERMKNRRKELGYSAEYVANCLGISPATIYRYEKGDIEKVPGDILEPLSNALHTTPKYLMGWDDEVAVDTDPTPDLSERALRVGYMYDIAAPRDKKFVDLTLEPYEDKVQVPARVIPIKKVSAPVRDRAYPKVKRRKDGFGEITVYEDQLPAAGPSSYFDAPRSHIEQYPLELIPQGTTFAVPIAGNSMEPKFKNGATVFVQSAPRVENGEVGLFSLNGAPYIKQLVVDDARHEVRLHSLNPAYDDIAVGEFDDLRTFGRVLGSYSVWGGGATV